MGCETMIMLIATKYISLYWSSNVIGKPSHHSKLYVIGVDLFKQPPDEKSCKFVEIV